MSASESSRRRGRRSRCRPERPRQRVRRIRRSRRRASAQRGTGAAGAPASGARGQAEDDEHETPDYLKQFEHFADGRTVAPSVIGCRSGPARHHPDTSYTAERPLIDLGTVPVGHTLPNATLGVDEMDFLVDELSIAELPVVLDVFPRFDDVADCENRALEPWPRGPGLAADC